MRKLKVALLGAILVAGVLGGPAATSVAAQPETPTVYAGWACHPDGSGTVGPTTTLSVATLYEDPSDDYITCLFRDYAPKGTLSFQFGGECYFDVPANGAGTTAVNRIEFAHRVWIVQNGSAKLFCWDGEEGAD